ncbi:hypothetical protein [Epilithonimonas xixisoli]|uniref:Uncharacterized protein n=1 Tax=Epilithonimonas xixisoli TaxID=1476462 RepID=A0A4R8IFT4_9FLAO|nr:hypothetical protein [Epilithonimonas xixisoli]TDX84590.1 hypothetical protein B0I22_2216 [Epilithonimonas xixisoli]
MKILNRDYLVLILFFFNCSSTKTIYENALSVDRDDKGSIFLLEKVQLKKDQSIIFFTETFDNIVEIREDEKIVYNKKDTNYCAVGIFWFLYYFT